MRIGNLEIDNNNVYVTNYPIVLLKKRDFKIENKPILNILLKKRKQFTEVYFYESLIFEMEQITLKIEQSFINKIIDYIQIIAKMIDNKVPISKLPSPSSFYWKTIELSSISSTIFIQKLIISPLLINTSYTSGFNIERKHFSIFTRAIGIAMKNIDNAPISLKGMEIIDYYDTLSGFFNKILFTYKEHTAKEFFKIIGSIDLIGNPIGLFNHVCAGFSDLIEKPAEGFIIGPLEGGVGLMQGFSSLISNTFVGTFNSLNKISGSIGSGLASLSQDQEFLLEREKIKMQKASNLVQGLNQAGVSIFKGFETGITGAFSKPIKGAKKEGVSGFLKGAFNGLTGLFIKPMTGIIDATSKTAEGLKNNLSYENMVECRARYIRVFYGFEGFYQGYNENDAEIVNLFQCFKKGKYSNCCYIGNYFVDNEFHVILTIEFVFNFNLKKKKKEWDIKTGNIAKIDKFKDGLKVILKEKTKKFNENVVLIYIKDDLIKNEMEKKINEIVEWQEEIEKREFI